VAEVTYPSLYAVPQQAQQYSSSNTNLGLTTPDPPSNTIVGSGKAGEALEACRACRFNSSGQVFKSSGAAADANAVVDGWTMRPYAIGATVSLYTNVSIGYGTAIVSGQFYYLSGTVPGGIATTASTGGTVPIARGVPDNSVGGQTKVPRLRVRSSW